MDKEIVEYWANYARSMVVYGRRVDEMNRDELMACVGAMRGKVMNLRVCAAELLANVRGIEDDARRVLALAQQM